MIDDVLTLSVCGTNSILLNSAVQSKMSTKRLTLSKDKCVKLHFGQDTENCPRLKMGHANMSLSCKQKYLGEIYTTDNRSDETILMRHNKGLGIANTIISIVKHISFGYYSFEIALILRNSLLLNGILFSIETFFNLNNNHIKLLEDCDLYLWRKLFTSPLTTPYESFFIETSSIPLRFTIMGRKFMYLWTLLRKPNDELVSRVFHAQNDIEISNSWVSKIKKDLREYDIFLSFQDIQNHSKSEFKSLVSSKIRKKANIFLHSLQDTHSKTRNLQIGTKMSDYLLSTNLSLLEKQTLFKLRCKVVKCKAYYKTMYQNDLECSFCELPDTTDSIEHYFDTCKYLSTNEKFKTQFQSLRYSDLYGELPKQIEFVKLWLIIERERESIVKIRQMVSTIDPA